MAINFFNSLAVGTDVLYVDTLNDRVGIGTSSPDTGTNLHVSTSSLSGQIKLESQENTQFQFYGDGNQDINYGQPPNFPLPGGDAIGQIRYNHGSNYMAFKVNNAEMVRFASNNYVGIGTTSPGAKLHARDSSTSPGIIIESDGGNEQFVIKRYSNTNEQLILGFHSSDYGTIQAVEQGVSYRNLALNASGGNVGIGTTSPSAKLHVAAASGDGLKIITSDVSTIKMGSTTGATSYWGFATTNLAASDFGIYQSNSTGGDPITAGTPRLYFSSIGNIGVGTSSPINGGGNAKWITIDATSANSYSGGIVYSIGGSGKAYHYVENDYLIHQGQSNVGHKFVTNGTTERLRIGSAGQIGIGGANYGTSGQVLTSNGSGSAPSWQNASGSSNWTLSGNDIYNNNSGNVGIGTSSPSAKLDVSGDAVDDVGLARFTNNYASGGTHFPTASFINSRGNHSYGVVADFSVASSTDGDRPSILFYGGQSSTSWQIGQQTGTSWAGGLGMTNGFGIGYRASNNPSSFTAWPTAYLSIDTSGNIWSYASHRAPIFYDSNNTVYYVDPNGSTTSAILNGNVGIGTTSPGAKLEVRGSGDGDLFIGRHSSNTSKLIYGYQSSSDGFLELRTGSDATVTKLSGYIGTPSYFLSNVGVGTASPGYKLDVSGNIRIGGVGESLLFDTTSSPASNGIRTINDYETVIYNGRGAAGFAVVGNTNIRLGFGTSYTAGQSAINILHSNKSIEHSGNIISDAMQRPVARWGVGSASTGMVAIALPGDTGDYDMTTIEIEVYEYNSNAGSKIRVSGHPYNSGTGWYNYSVSIDGVFNKSIYLGKSSSKFYILLGDTSSSWTYGSVIVRANTEAEYYNNITPWGDAWSITQVTTDPTSVKTSNLNTTSSRTSYTYGYSESGGSFRAPVFYDSDNTGYYLNPSSNATSINVRGEIQNPSVWINDGDNNNNYNENIRLFNAPNGVSVIAFSASGTGGVPTTSLLGYSDRLETRYQSNWQTRVYNGYAQANGSYRAPIFYDSDNTGYYVNPTGGSQLADIYYNAWLRNNRTASSSGLYWESGTPGAGWHIYPVNTTDMFIRSGGTSNGSLRLTVGNETARGYLYWDTGNNVGFLSSAAGWSFRVDNSGNTFATTSHRAPIFYDSNDTGYYVDPASTSIVNTVTANDALQAYHIGIRNTSNGTKDGISLYGGATGGEPTYGLMFTGTSGSGTHGDVTGDWATYFTMNNDNSRGWIFRRVGSGNSASISAGGVGTFDSSVKSPTFYDSNNTAYYTDPAGLSAMHSLKLIKHQNHTPRWDFSAYVVESPHHYSTSSTGAMYIGESNTVNIRSTGIASSDFRAPIFYDSNDTGYYADPASTSVFNGLTVGGSNVLTEADPAIVRRRGTITSQDWNTYIDGTEAGWYQVNNASGSNKPPAYTYGTQLNFSSASANKLQIYAPHNGTDGNGVWIRTGWNTDYDAWREIPLYGMAPYSGGDLRASAFYDSNNTGYYVNPASTSVLDRIVVGDGSTSSGGTALRVEDTFTGNNTHRIMEVKADQGTVFAYGAKAARFYNVAYGGGAIEFYRPSQYGPDTNAVAFVTGSTTVGSISMTGSATSYNTTSDYRLKENIIDITDGTERVKQLKPRRFNFIEDPDNTVDGFIAHEADLIVPESVTGEKDEVYPNGEPVYQSMDNAKLVPVLTAALQEAIAKIEDLETRIQILENQ